MVDVWGRLLIDAWKLVGEYDNASDREHHPRPLLGVERRCWAEAYCYLTSNARLRPEADLYLEMACEFGWLELAAKLCGFLDAAAIRNRNCQAVRIACQHGHAPVVDLLRTQFELGAADARVMDGWALSAAASLGHSSVVSALRRYGLGAGDLRANDYTALRLACRHGHAGAALALLDEYSLEPADVKKAGILLLPLVPAVRQAVRGWLAARR